MKSLRVAGIVLLSMGIVSSITGQVYRPDNLIALNSDLSDIVGADIYNTDGTNQTKEDTVALEHTATFYIKIENDGSASDVIIVTGPAGDASWDIKYFDDLTGGNNITSQVTSTGWATQSLSPGTEFAYLRVEVTPDTSVPGGTTKDILITSTSSHASDSIDAVLARVTAHKFQPDNIIAGNIDGSDYVGKNIYNTTGTDQTKKKSIPQNNTVSYYIKIENDGTIQDSFSITGTSGDASWTVQYFDDYTGGSGITADITGAGWHTGSIDPADSVRIRLEVTPAPDVPGGEKKTVLITSTSINFSSQKDAVKAITTVPAYQPDNIIATNPNMSGAVGRNIYNADAHNQTKAREVDPGDTALYYIEIQNDGTDNDVINVTAPPAKPGWKVHYYEDSDDISSQIMSPTGWFTGSLAGGDSKKIKLEVIPATSLTPGRVDSILITSTSQMDDTKNDVVMAVTTVQRRQPDNWIALEEDFSDQEGDGVYNTTGENQTKLLEVYSPDSALFYVRIENEGSVPDSFVVTASPTPPNWMVVYYDSVEAGSIITMPWGVALDPSAKKDIRVMVKPGSGAPPDEEDTLLIISTSTRANTKKDAVRAITVNKKGITEKPQDIPERFEINSLSSNPFKNILVISYAVPKTSRVSIKVYDIIGKLVATLENGLKEAGVYKLKWDTEGIPVGVYFYRMEAEGFTKTEKFVKLR